jgi:protein NrfD
MPDTLFTKPPHWEWLIVWYFFVGGIAGGCYFLAALLDLWGDEQDRPTARLGYYVAFIGVVLSGLFLTLDLNRPERFWHMLIMSERGEPMFKYWSPMSMGSWALLLFGGFAFLSAMIALAEDGVVRWRWPHKLRHGVAEKGLAMLGGLCGFFVAGYTGVLFTVTNRPLWSDTNLLGLLFLSSSASTAAACLLLLCRWRGAGELTLRWLSRLDSRLTWLELLVLALFVIWLGANVQWWFNVWGFTLGLRVVFLSILVPLVLHARPKLLGRARPLVSAASALCGGFILRAVIVLSAQRL